MTKTCSMRCIFAGMQKKSIVSALNGITISKIQDQILTLINWETCRVYAKLKKSYLLCLGIINLPMMLIMFSVTVL